VRAHGTRIERSRDVEAPVANPHHADIPGSGNRHLDRPGIGGARSEQNGADSDSGRLPDFASERRQRGKGGVQQAVGDDDNTGADDLSHVPADKRDPTCRVIGPSHREDSRAHSPMEHGPLPNGGIDEALVEFGSRDGASFRESERSWPPAGSRDRHRRQRTSTDAGQGGPQSGRLQERDCPRAEAAATHLVPGKRRAVDQEHREPPAGEIVCRR
jgi:hypothetical protein